MKIVIDVFPAKTVMIPPDHGLSDEEYHALAMSGSQGVSITGSRRIDAVRVVVTDEIVMVAADSHQGPMLIFREKYILSSAVIKKRNEQSRLMTVSGKILLFTKDDDCGCGSKLRAWNPYNTVYSTKDPG